jgi:hypothetical protein
MRHQETAKLRAVAQTFTISLSPSKPLIAFDKRTNLAADDDNVHHYKFAILKADFCFLFFRSLVIISLLTL